MMSVFTGPMCDIDTNEDLRTCEEQEKHTRFETETQRKKEPQTHGRCYKLAAVSVTMYINSHTSF